MKHLLEFFKADFGASFKLGVIWIWLPFHAMGVLSLRWERAAVEAWLFYLAPIILAVFFIRFGVYFAICRNEENSYTKFLEFSAFRKMD